MQAEVDQSGRIEETNKDTVLALANGIHYSIRISAKSKRLCLNELSRRRGRRKKVLYILVFATMLYLLLKRKIRNLSSVVVDKGFPGHGPAIKTHVMNLFRRRGKNISPDLISFHQIGKKSPAHDLAIKVYRGKAEPDWDVSALELLGEFKK
jgi:hypothetical protein